MQPLPYFRALRILHLALCAGLTLFTGIIIVFYFMKIVPVGATDGLNGILLPVAFGTLALMLAAANFIFRRRVAAIQGMSSVDEKLNAYRSVSIARWAMLEAPALLGNVCFMLTGNMLFFICVAPALLLMVLQAPTREKAIRDMALPWEEAAELNSRD